MDEDEIRRAEKESEYNRNFLSVFGEIDPNHSWGFGEMPKAITFGSLRSTRADGSGDYSGVGNVHVKRNEWANPNPGVEERLDDKVAIPGWPNFNGKYYAMEGNYGSRIVEPGNVNVGSDFPAGDVTDYEVWYVSKWFRENGNIKSNIQLHLSDFFIQNISCDYDRETYPVATGEAAKPYAAPLGTPITQFDATAHPTHHITGSGNDASSLNYGMDHLVFQTLESNANIDDTWTHMNNYNNGNTNHMYMVVDDVVKQQYDQREIKYVTSSGTEDFAYQSSLATGDEKTGTYYDKWVLVKLEWDEPYGGQTYHRVGYYLAFDYETTKGDIRIEPDGHYSNWIVKITPGNYIPQKENLGWPRRIMCEDLGNTFDFDFNDVVFDLLFERTSGTSDDDPAAKFDAIITLQAAGGTMDIKVGNNSKQYEVHSLFNEDVQTPVNVGGISHATAIYRVHNCTTKSDDQIDIWVNGTAMPRVHRAGLDNFNGGVQANPGNRAPQKFCVPNTVRWTKELKHINNPYPHFKDWVNDEHGSYRDFNSDPDATLGAEYKRPWYDNTNVNKSCENQLMSGTGFSSTYYENADGSFNYRGAYGNNVEWSSQQSTGWDGNSVEGQKDIVFTNTLGGNRRITLVFEDANPADELSVYIYDEESSNPDKWSAFLDENSQPLKMKKRNGVNNSVIYQFDFAAEQYKGKKFKLYSGSVEECSKVKGVFVQDLGNYADDLVNGYNVEGGTRMTVVDYYAVRAVKIDDVDKNINDFDLYVCYTSTDANAATITPSIKKSGWNSGQWAEGDIVNTPTCTKVDATDSHPAQFVVKYSGLNKSQLNAARTTATFTDIVLSEPEGYKLTGVFYKAVSSSAKLR